MWQKFCSKQCQQKWNKDRYRAEAVEEAEERREAKMNGHGTPEQRQKASEALTRIVEERRNERRMFRRM
jgi:hypothetical protein